MNMKNQNGFTLVEAMLVVIALTLVSFAGWYVWNENKEEKPAQTKQTTQKKESKKTVVADPTKDWTPYSSTSGAFSLKYPTTWMTAWNQSDCSADLLLLGPTKESAGACASDGGAQVLVSAQSGDYSDSYTMSAQYYTDITNKPVTIDSVSGARWSGTVKDTGEEGLGPVPGTKEVRYVFSANDKTYVVTYAQSPTQTNVLSDFELIVTKTLKLN